MIKKNKNVDSKERNKKKPLEDKPKQNIKEKNKSGTPVIPLKRIKTSTLNKKQFNKNSKIFNSVLSKEETKKKMSPTIRNRLNNQALTNNNNANTNTNKLFSSNNLFSTRDTDSIYKEKETQLNNYSKKNKIIHKTQSQKETDLFKYNFLKQTIIIDNDGNNNLNLNLNNFGKNDYKNILNYNKNQIEFFNDNIGNSDSINFLYNNESNSLFENSQSNKNSISKDNQENDIRQTPTEKNEEEKRIKEYNKIFNLLNTNIEQFKKMFNNNIIMNKDKNKKIIIKKKTSNSNTNTLPTDNINHRKYKINNCKKKNYEVNFKKNLSEENLRSSIKYNNKANNYNINNDNDIKNNLKNNIELKSNYSFLESSIDNDFYQAFTNQTLLQNNSRNSLDININKKSNDENIQSLTKENKDNNFKAYDINAAKIDINSNKENLKNSQNSTNQKLLVKHKTLEKISGKKIDDDNQNDNQSYINYLDKNNCIIF